MVERIEVAPEEFARDIECLARRATGTISGSVWSMLANAAR